MASSKWKSFEELTEIARQREILFWGASIWIEQTLERAALAAAAVLDNNPNNQGIEYQGLPVFAPRQRLAGADPRPFVIITTVNYESVIDELGELGYVMGDDYCVTPLLNVRADKDALKSLDVRILVSSPEHRTTKTDGGGLYEVATRNHAVTKVYGGKGRGLAAYPAGYAWVDMLRGIVLLDKSYNEVGLVELQPNAEPHGLWFDKQRELLCVAQPGRDSLALYEFATGRLQREIYISDKWSRNKKDNHHVNDLIVAGDSLFVALFSFSGNWPNEVYDGGVLEIDLVSGEIVGPVLANMWMPHSVRRFEGRLMAVDSMRGELVEMSWRTAGKFPGFIRGLDYDGRYYYVGVSEHRYPEKLYGEALNIGLDSGVAIFDARTKMSRFIAMPQVTSVHAVMVVGQD